MACSCPLTGYRSNEFTKNGKQKIVLSSRKLVQFYGGNLKIPKQLILKLPCGKCDGCRLERSRQWAIRCVHEASLYENNCFITLTYSPEYVPEDMSLRLSDFQDFMKRLRRNYDYHRGGKDVRYYHSGEYGENFGRPHYHALLFNYYFKDLYYWRTSDTGNPVFRSPTLEKLWPFGYSEVGSVTFNSAAYVARYIMKKVTGNKADDHYVFQHPVTGEVTWRDPEYSTMSRKPGIARAWFEKHHQDVFPKDMVLINGKKQKPPRFYDSLFEIFYPQDYELMKLKRTLNAREQDDSPRRLMVLHELNSLRAKKLVRTLDKN